MLRRMRRRREPASEVELWEIMAGAAGPRQGAHNEDERLAVEQTNQTIQRNKMNLICLVVAWRAERINQQRKGIDWCCCCAN